MENKTITVNNNEFNFLFDENLNMWRVIESSNLIGGNVIDLEIDLKNVDNILDWNSVIKFIQLLNNCSNILNERVQDASSVLNSLFKSINRKAYEEFFF